MCLFHCKSKEFNFFLSHNWSQLFTYTIFSFFGKFICLFEDRNIQREHEGETERKERERERRRRIFCLLSRLTPQPVLSQERTRLQKILVGLPHG